MPIIVVRLGADRQPGEGLRLGTVRRPPRGVPKAEYARRNYFDVWLPILAPASATVRQALSARTAPEWKRFVTAYRREMQRPEQQATLKLLAALSKQTNFSVGCYCIDESRCHRLILRALLAELGAELTR